MMDEEIMMCRPCKYDRFSPCECCGKCAPKPERDEDEAYSQWKGDREMKEMNGDD